LFLIFLYAFYCFHFQCFNFHLFTVCIYFIPWHSPRVLIVLFSFVFTFQLYITCYSLLHSVARSTYFDCTFFSTVYHFALCILHPIHFCSPWHGPRVLIVLFSFVLTFQPYIPCYSLLQSVARSTYFDCIFLVLFSTVYLFALCIVHPIYFCSP